MSIFRAIDLVRRNFRAILHCRGCFSPSGFICIQQCCGFALYVESIGEAVARTFLWSFETFSLPRWRSFADFLELKCIDVCLVLLQVDAKWSWWLASIFLNSGSKVQT